MIMKIALLFALYISSATAGTCYILACASSVGNACGVTGTGSPSTYTTCTNTNQFCNSTNGNTGVCANKYSLGQSCTSSELCASSYCNQAGVCANGDLANGQKCTYNADCNSDNCASNVCAGSGLGGSCSNSANCNVADNLYCSSGSCVANTGINAACSGQTCADGLYCSSVTNKCIAQFSFSSGAACSDDTVSTAGSDNDNQCGDGLTCVSGKCAAAPTSSNTKCTKDSDCTAANEACTCNYNTGSGTCQSEYTVKLSGATATANGVTSCYTGACSGDQSTSCAISKCKSIYCAAERYFVNTYNEGSSNLPSCALSGSQATVPSICNGASSVAISAFVVFAALAALMM